MSGRIPHESGRATRKRLGTPVPDPARGENEDSGHDVSLSGMGSLLRDSARLLAASVTVNRGDRGAYG